MDRKPIACSNTCTRASPPATGKRLRQQGTRQPRRVRRGRACRKWKRPCPRRTAAARKPKPRRSSTQMLKRHDRFAPATSAGIQRAAESRQQGPSGWGFVAYALDYRHECAWNLKNNCRGAQRLAYRRPRQQERGVRVLQGRNCESKDFVTGNGGGALSREVLIGPAGDAPAAAGRRLRQPDKKAMTGQLHAVPKLAAERRRGQVPRTPQGSIDVAAFLSRVSQERGYRGHARGALLGAARMRMCPPMPRSSAPAAMPHSTMRPSTRFAAASSRSDCDYGLSSIRIAFKLQD